MFERLQGGTHMLGMVEDDARDGLVPAGNGCKFRVITIEFVDVPRFLRFNFRLTDPPVEILVAGYARLVLHMGQPDQALMLHVTLGARRRRWLFPMRVMDRRLMTGKTGPV